MGSSSKQKSNSTSTYTPTPQASGVYNSTLTQAQNVANTAYNPATNQNIASFTPDQLAAFGGINSSINNWSPYLNQAAQFGTAAAAPVSGAQIQNYMDPYQQQVVDATTAQLQHQNAVQQSQLQGNQVSNNALGNNRAGIAAAELARGQNANMASTIGQLNSAGFGQALGAAQADQSRMLQASGNMSNIAGQQQNLTLQGLMAQLASGNQQQQQQQNVNNANTANAQASTMWPYQNTQWLASIASALGPLTGGTTTGNSTSTTTQGKGAGQIAGGALSALAMFSDRRMKEDVSEIGRTHDGQPIYKFRYKGDTKHQLGLMADEVQGSHPESVHTGPGGMQMVNYDKATEGAERDNYASGGGVGFGGASYFPWADLHANQPIMPALSSSSASTTQQPQDSFDPRKAMQLGKDARAGFDSLLGGTSNSLSGLGSLFDFAAGGGVPFGDDPFFIDPRTGRVHPPTLKDENIGEIGPSSRGGIDYPTSDDSGRIIDLPDGGPMDPPSAGVPPVGSPQSADAKLAFDGSGFGLYGRPGGNAGPHFTPPAGAPPAAESGGWLSRLLHGFGDMGSGADGGNLPPSVPPTAPTPAAAVAQSPGGADSEASSPLLTGKAGAPDAGNPAPQIGPAAVRTESAGPGLATNDFIKGQEGFTAKAVWDNNAYRNGYGTVAKYPGEVISRDEAQRRLDSESGSVGNWLDKNVKVPMTDQQRAGLTSLGFNVGTGAKGLGRLLPDINAGNWDSVAKRILSFNHETKNGQLVVNDGLTARRQREAALISQTGPLGPESPPTAAPHQVQQLAAKATDPAAPSQGGYTSPVDRHTGGLLQRWFGIDFNPLKLNENERMAMLHAGLSMMQTGNIGSGVEGLKFLRDKNQQDIENQMNMAKMNAGQIHQTGTNSLGLPQFSIYHPITNQIEPIAGAQGNNEIKSPDDLPAWAQEKAKRVIAGLEDMPKPTKGDPTANMVAQGVRLMDPGYNANRFNFQKKWNDQNGFIQKTLTANGTAMTHASALSDLADNLPDTGYRSLNYAKNWWKAETTDPQLLAYRATADLLSKEIVRVMNPTTGGGQKEYFEQLEKLDPANGSKAIKGVLAEYTKRMADRTKQLTRDWKSNMGDVAEAPVILDDDAKAAYSKLVQKYGEDGKGAPAAPKLERPAGVSEEDIIADAERQLRAGKKSPEAVKARVQQYGIDPARLHP